MRDCVMVIIMPLICVAALVLMYLKLYLKIKVDKFNLAFKLATALLLIGSLVTNVYLLLLYIPATVIMLLLRFMYTKELKSDKNGPFIAAITTVLSLTLFNGVILGGTLNYEFFKMTLIESIFVLYLITM